MHNNSIKVNLLATYQQLDMQHTSPRAKPSPQQQSQQRITKFLANQHRRNINVTLEKEIKNGSIAYVISLIALNLDQEDNYACSYSSQQIQCNIRLT